MIRRRCVNGHISTAPKGMDEETAAFGECTSCGDDIIEATTYFGKENRRTHKEILELKYAAQLVSAYRTSSIVAENSQEIVKF